MTTVVATTTRDAWADATQLATQEELDDHVVAARRQAWVRRALPIVANIRSSAAGRDLKLVGPADLLARAERAWVRGQINAGRAVPANRRVVVVATARRMSDEGRTVLLRVGQMCIFGGLLVSSPTPFTVVFVSGLVVCTLAAAIRDQVLARRARRWLGFND